MASDGFNQGPAYIIANGWNGLTNLQVLLLQFTDGGPNYTFDRDHDFVSDLVAFEVSGGAGYTRKSITTGLTTTVDDVSDEIRIDLDDPSPWGGANFGKVQAMVLFAQVTNDSDSVLLYYHDGPSWPVLTNSGQLTLQWPTDGISYFKSVLA